MHATTEEACDRACAEHLDHELGGPIRPVTPALVIDLSVVRARVAGLRSALPGFDIHYAVKANPTPHLLASLADLEVGFDVASAAEAELVLDRVGAPPSSVVYAHPVKPSAHIRRAHELGVTRFAVDGVDELDKIARTAPGAQVFVRMAPRSRSTAVLPLDDKFGVAPAAVADIASAAIRRGLEPVGVSFHVGSQACDPRAWSHAIADAGDALRSTAQVTGRRLGWLDVGGGFPSTGHPGWTAPTVETIGSAVRAAFAQLPWPVRGACEPGRFIVGDAGTVHTTVIGTATRGGRRWVHVDAGVFHGLSEVLESYGGFPFAVSASAPDAAHLRGDGSQRSEWIVAGPSCDSADRLRGAYVLPASLTEGDRLEISSTGAYSVALTTSFNGFAPMTAWTVDDRSLVHGDETRVLALAR